MSYTRRVAALALVAAATMACGATRPAPVVGPPSGAAAADPQPQPASPPSPPLPIEATASLAGAITAAPDGMPLARARVTATSPALSGVRVAITDAQGRYEMTRLPAGTYVVEVTRTGYVPQRFGERGGAAPPAVSVAAGQRLHAIDVALAPAGAIAGRVLDEDGTPLAGARVDALVPRVEHGQQTLRSAAAAHTDDRGEFRVIGLAAGHYYVGAFDPAFANAADEAGPLRYTPTYFPGVAIVDQAERVTVMPGAEPRRVEFRLRLARPSRVSGRLTTPQGGQLVSGAVIMTPLSGGSLAPIPPHDVEILPDGRFTFRNVPPGRYRIRARGRTSVQNATLFATFIVLVDGRDTTDVTMLLEPGGSVAGTVVLDSRVTPRATLTDIRVRAPFVDGSTFGESPAGEVGPDGTFEIRDLMAGARYITVEGLPSPWVLKDVTYRGRAITDLAVDVEAGDQFRDMRVTLTDRASEMTGTVRDRRGAAVDGALVVVVPPAPTLWTPANRRFRVARSDASGRYRLRGLPAGEYRAFASTELDESDVYRRETLEALVEAAVALTIAEEGVRTLDLPVVVPPAQRSSTR